jgi:predicted RNA-binding protein with PIN domain
MVYSSMTKATVLIDARNVLRSKWPNIPEDELVERCRAWAKEHKVDAVIVFDGTAPGGVAGEQELDANCTLVGTGRKESADEWLIRSAPGYERYWLVTSDRELRERAGQRAERTIGGGSFARDLP